MFIVGHMAISITIIKMNNIMILTMTQHCKPVVHVDEDDIHEQSPRANVQILSIAFFMHVNKWRIFFLSISHCDPHSGFINIHYLAMLEDQFIQGGNLTMDDHKLVVPDTYLFWDDRLVQVYRTVKSSPGEHAAYVFNPDNGRMHGSVKLTCLRWAINRPTIKSSHAEDECTFLKRTIATLQERLSQIQKSTNTEM